jgi:hypothetical protein
MDVNQWKGICVKFAKVQQTRSVEIKLPLLTNVTKKSVIAGVSICAIAGLFS